MASITAIGSRFRAQIRRAGFRSCAKTFDTRHQAVEWADKVESAINSASATTPTGRRAIAELLFAPEDMTEAQIVEDSVPVGGCVGVYALIKANRIIYIGMSRSIMTRIAKHWANRLDFDAYRIFECQNAEHAAAIERRLLAKFRPRLNLSVPENAAVSKTYQQEANTAFS